MCQDMPFRGGEGPGGEGRTIKVRRDGDLQDGNVVLRVQRRVRACHVLQYAPATRCRLWGEPTHASGAAARARWGGVARSWADVPI